MTDNTPIKLTKLEAAKRQIDTAIDLYFSSGDPVSAYGLTFAATDVVRNIATARRVETTFNDFMKVIKPEKQKEFVEFIKKPQMFIKHADRDPEGTIEFLPRSYELALFMACMAYADLTLKSSRNMEMYYVWILTQYPEWIISEGGYREYIEQIAACRDANNITKETVYEFRNDPDILGATSKLQMLKNHAIALSATRN